MPPKNGGIFYDILIYLYPGLITLFKKEPLDLAFANFSTISAGT